jgi:hypothetical protein
MIIATMKDSNPPTQSMASCEQAEDYSFPLAARSPGRRVTKDPDNWRASLSLSGEARLFFNFNFVKDL